MFFAIILLEVAFAACDDDQNHADLYINPTCNWAGICGGGDCYCCNSISETDFCAGVVPGVWTIDENCEKVTYFTSVTWGYIFNDADVYCANDGVNPSVPSFLNTTKSVISTGYDGVVLALACQSCTVASPCLFFTEGSVADSGTFVKFGTDLNTQYDLSCGTDALPTSTVECENNLDKGASANVVLLDVLDEANDYQLHVAAMNAELGGSITVQRVFSSTQQIVLTSYQTTRFPSPMPSSDPTPEPSPRPTTSPTTSPTDILLDSSSEEPDNECSEYVNSVDDLKFVAAGSSCRGNINESWTGGRTCDSPYVICLPLENTPSFDIMGEPYKNQTYRYTVQDCLKECSYDQRCLGVEFRADLGSNRGDCYLIDDIPIAVEDVQYISDVVLTESVLDSSTTGGDALCWQKEGQCNPYFEAEDLNDVMLNCYCPNNRKGFYTKKVKRTVNNTRFCYDDSSVDERIKKAQANRMFHLCENWCLFETSNPVQENWYWDPWKQCWRETYSAVGVHTGYCDRVIRNPDSIELKFVDYRLDHFCDVTEQPTSAPVPDSNTTWVLAELLESCDDACSREGGSCAAEQTTRRFATESALTSAFSEVGITCESSVMNRTKFEGYALPGVFNSITCVNRQLSLNHLQDLDSDCNRIIGGEWQRLCACFF